MLAITSQTTNLPQDIQQGVSNFPTLNYTPFKKINTILEGPTIANLNANETDYIYGPDHQRKQSVQSANSIRLP